LALAELAPGKSVSQGRAFRQHVRQLLLRCSDSGRRLCWRKGVDILVDSRLRGLSTPTHRRTGEWTSKAQIKSRSREPHALALAFCSGAQDARRSTLGPLCSGGRVEESPQGGRHGCRPVWRQGGVFSWALLFYFGHPALRPSGRLRRSRMLLHARGQAKEKCLALRRRVKALL
jgi:hypothetical protein